ncbi:biotin--[acetyl-CoA-carboxylase] ligase [Pleurocapsales cyanobacterium LEGE 10410]|nr:biotin--[acetyl-CoA-carboxylase] ligase [Pleurocapsales cyanobacterium LEGE 10410]
MNDNFAPKLYQQFWQRVNQSCSIAPLVNIEEAIPLFIFDSIPSTNTKTWELIDRQVETPVGAIALQQTAGKGQWGHSWISTTGGLYLSVGLELDLDTNSYPHLVMATAWGIASVLRHYALPVTIKWSNDLILERRKLGGIKIETRNDKNRIVKAVVGVGINWCNSVPKPGITLASYYQNKATKNINSLEELTAIAAYGIVLGYQHYLSAGIEKLLDQYLEILDSLGQQVMFNNCPGEVTGVTTEGKLKVKLRSPGASTEITLLPGQISLGYA